MFASSLIKFLRSHFQVIKQKIQAVVRKLQMALFQSAAILVLNAIVSSRESNLPRGIQDLREVELDHLIDL